MDPRPLAIFDLDGTLIRGDTFLPFLISFCRRRRRWWPLVTMPFVVGAYAARLLPDYAAKQRLLVSCLGGRTLAEIAEHADWFCDRWVASRLHPVGIERLRHHQAAGHRVILLSASPDLYVTTISRFLGIAETVCTRVSISGEQCLGTLSGGNCKGAFKLRSLQGHLGIDESPPESYAYGDSRHDLPMLQWVEHGMLVRRDGLQAVTPTADFADGNHLGCATLQSNSLEQVSR